MWWFIHAIMNMSLNMCTIVPAVQIWVYTWALYFSMPAWISNYIHYKVWDEITFPFPNLLKFGNGWVISSHTLFGMWLLIHAVMYMSLHVCTIVPAVQTWVYPCCATSYSPLNLLWPFQTYFTVSAFGFNLGQIPVLCLSFFSSMYI